MAKRKHQDVRLTLTAVRLPSEVLEGLRRVRERDGVGISEQVRRALTIWLKARRALPKRGRG